MLRTFYFLWLLLQFTALYFSGWYQRINLQEGSTWRELTGYNSEFFLIQSFDLATYDLSEFLLYYAFLPYFLYRIVVMVKDA